MNFFLSSLAIIQCLHTESACAYLADNNIFSGESLAAGRLAGLNPGQMNGDGDADNDDSLDLMEHSNLYF